MTYLPDPLDAPAVGLAAATRIRDLLAQISEDDVEAIVGTTALLFDDVAGDGAYRAAVEVRTSLNDLNLPDLILSLNAIIGACREFGAGEGATA